MDILSFGASILVLYINFLFCNIETQNKKRAYILAIIYASISLSIFVQRELWVTVVDTAQNLILYFYALYTLSRKPKSPHMYWLLLSLTSAACVYITIEVLQNGVTKESLLQSFASLSGSIGLVLYAKSKEVAGIITFSLFNICLYFLLNKKGESVFAAAQLFTLFIYFYGITLRLTSQTKINRQMLKVDFTVASLFILIWYIEEPAVSPLVLTGGYLGYSLAVPHLAHKVRRIVRKLKKNE